MGKNVEKPSGSATRKSPKPSTRSCSSASHRTGIHPTTTAVIATRKLGIITADISVALSLSVTHRAIGFDRRMPEINFDSLDLPSAGTLPSRSITRNGPPGLEPGSSGGIPRDDRSEASSNSRCARL